MNKRPFMKRFEFMISDWLLLRRRPYIMILIAAALPAIYFFVYSTGGIKYVYSHSMYIPIIFAGIYFGATFGVLIGLIAAILLEPLMPIDSITGEMQDPINWLYRMAIFILVGLIIGIASNKLRKDSKQIRNLMSVNQESNIPNTNYLKDFNINFLQQPHSVYTILIGNHHSIVDLLGVGIYHKFIFKIYSDLIKKLPEKSIVIQSDQGSQFIGPVYAKLLSGHNVRHSVSYRGNCVDNAPIESWFSALKTESIYLYHALSENGMVRIVDQYVKYYNEERLQENIKELAPMDYRKQALSTLF